MKNKHCVGIGLRSKHYPNVLRGEARVGWFEIITENYVDTGGQPLHILEKVRADFPIGMHGVSLNIGSSDPVDKKYLKKVKAFKNRIRPAIVTDHLCWGGIEGRNWHDLLPVPMTSEMVKHITKKVKQVQETLETTIALENISTYLRFKNDDLKEWEFTRAILEEADCHLLLDVNNVYVNSINHGMDAFEFIGKMPAERVKQYHLAGHSTFENFLFDTHDHPVCDPVWDLFKHASRVIGPRPFILERDDHIPELKIVEDEALHAGRLMDEEAKKIVQKAAWKKAV